VRKSDKFECWHEIHVLVSSSGSSGRTLQLVGDGRPYGNYTQVLEDDPDWTDSASSEDEEEQPEPAGNLYRATISSSGVTFELVVANPTAEEIGKSIKRVICATTNFISTFQRIWLNLSLCRPTPSRLMMSSMSSRLKLALFVRTQSVMSSLGLVVSLQDFSCFNYSNPSLPGHLCCCKPCFVALSGKWKCPLCRAHLKTYKFMDV